MRLALITPLDPRTTGVADYSLDLLPHLAAAAGEPITVFTSEAEARSGLSWSAYPIGQLCERVDHFDLLIYQLGNSPAHDFMVEALLQWPGLVVLHDVSLHYFFARQPLARYLRVLGYSYGLIGTQLGRRFLREFTPVNYPEYLVSEALVDRSPGVIVHSRHGLNLLSARCPTAQLEYVPMPIPLPPDRSLADARAQLNLPTDEFLIGVFGVLNDSKQPRVILAAMRQLLDEGLPIKAIFIGRENDTFHLAAEAPRLGLSEHVIALDFVADLSMVHDWLAACDVAINLRSPYWGETSASTLRMLAAGLPAIVNDVGAFAELPDTICFKLPPAKSELPGALAQALHQLYTGPARRAALRRAARQYVAQEHDPRHAAARYLEVATSILVAT